MITIAICDDDAVFMRDLTAKIRAYAKEVPELEIIPRCFDSTFSLLDNLQASGAADIYFLDIYIDGLNGIDAAREIRAYGIQSPIVFLTTSKYHAIDAFTVNAAHYLEKPINEHSLKEALNRTIRLLTENKQNTLLLFKNDSSIESVPFESIYYIQSEKKHQHIVASDRTITVRRSLKELYNALCVDDAFFMPHRTYVVNMRHIRRITHENIVIKGDVALPLVKRNYAHIKEQYMNYIFKLKQPYWEV